MTGFVLRDADGKEPLVKLVAGVEQKTEIIKLVSFVGRVERD